MNQQKQYVVAMVKTTFTVPKSLEEAELQEKKKVVRKLNIGKRYTLEEAEKRAGELQKTCQYELNFLDFDRFVAYNLNTPTE